MQGAEVFLLLVRLLVVLVNRLVKVLACVAWRGQVVLLVGRMGVEDTSIVLLLKLVDPLLERLDLTVSLTYLLPELILFFLVLRLHFGHIILQFLQLCAR